MTIKVALVTGSNSGLGASVCVKLAEQGYRVYASMRNLTKAQGLLEIIESNGLDIIICQLDVCHSESVNSCVTEILAAQGRIDVLVNNAGAGFIRSTEQASEEEIQWVMNLNFHGVVRCTKAVLPAMREARRGRIINISSIGGLVGQPFNEIYCAAKFAVEGYTESLASYLQPHFGIYFTAVEPAGIATEFANSAIKQMTNSGGVLDDPYQSLFNQYMVAARASATSIDGQGRYQTADQVADVVIECVVNPDPPIRIRSSEWAESFTKLKTQADPDGKKLQQKVIDTFLK
jgi:NAD(P)-dependent dehydrogenase (short-subunit alcohol dehydrogenase family)